MKFMSLGASFLGAMVLSGATYAFAATAYSTTKDIGPSDGINYENYAYIDNTSEIAWSVENTASGGNVPVSYMGSAAHLYEAGGALCAVSGWIYQDFVTNTWPVGVSAACGAGNYYSSGFTRAYNGNGYDTYSTDASGQLYFS